jgi:hypothetical protein
MAKSFRGENNYFVDAVENTIVVLKKFTKENNREIRNYYTEDVLNPICPCFVVLINGSKDEMRASQNLTRIRYTIHLNIEVRYYEEDLTEETKRNEITYVLWEISDLLKRNITLNGFVPKLGMEILSTRWGVQQKGTRLLAGGAINILAKKLYTSNL